MLKTKFKQTEIGLIPEDWEVQRIENVAIVIGGGTPSTLNPSYWNGEVEWFTPTEVGKSKYLNSSLRKITTLGLKNSSARILPKGTILMTTRASIGDLGILKKEASTNQGFQSLIPQSVNPEYLYYITLTLKESLLRNASGSTFLEISPSKVKSLQIPLPPLPEQTAIAEALSDSDAWIESLEKLIAKKRLIKQGAMQELLTPKEDWEVKKLGEILKLQGGFAFNSNDFTEYGISVIRISDIKGKNVDLSESTCVDNNNIPICFVVKKNDILIAMSGATTGKIGKYKSLKKAYINQRVGKFDIYNKGNYSLDYLFHILHTRLFKDQLSSMLAQGAQPNISGSQIESIVYLFPPLSEQTRIATILSDMDAEIESLEQKLSKARQIKQGMMQELLTGRIRLI